MKSVVFISLALSIFDQQVMKDQKWLSYKQDFNKTYLNKYEEAKRYSNFIANDEMIKAHNEKFSLDEPGYLMDHNQFSDMSQEEFSQIHLHEFSKEMTNLSYDSIDNSPIEKTPPPSLSYKKYCMPSKNQADCGSCWAFASTAHVEAILKMKDSSFETYISPQYLVDCSGAGGCGGGNPEKAIEFMVQNGFVSWNNYPYTKRDGRCKSNVKKMPEKISKNSLKFLNGNEKMLKQLLADVGPVVIAMTASRNFQYYKGGVYYNQQCPNRCRDMNHAMVLVGYGTDTSYRKPVDYWLIKNSYGADWGESGYIRMIRNHRNNCDVSCFAFYATV